MKHGHGKSGTVVVRRRRPRLPSARSARKKRVKFAGGHSRSRVHVHTNLRTVRGSRRRRGPGNSVPVLPVHGRHGNLFHVSGAPSHSARMHAELPRVRVLLVSSDEEDTVRCNCVMRRGLVFVANSQRCSPRAWVNPESWIRRNQR